MLNRVRQKYVIHIQTDKNSNADSSFLIPEVYSLPLLQLILDDKF